ncbi:MAG: hypothetical protein HC846_09030 [Blastocatellia bacterium]|nr:hypothetical protein [Blastocatellia bacterium]
MQRPNFEFTIPMALEDFIPVIFTAVGLYFLLKVIIRRHRNLCKLACLGATLVVTDGFLKATWKLIYAAAGIDIAWMKDSLFVLMGPGFIFVSWALWRGLKEKLSTTKQVWLIPLIVVIPSLLLSYYLATTQQGRSWARVLLMLTTIGILFTNGQIIADSLKRKLYLPIILLIINITTIFGQAFISQLPQTTALHWLGQINNTISWGAFALAVWLWQKRSL